MLDVARILEELAALRERDTNLRVFGAATHRYLLHPRLSETQVAAFETKWRLELPPDYRLFLIAIGNGGAGPAHGLFKLGEMDASDRMQRLVRGKFVGDPSRPFVHAKAWNLPKAFWAKRPKARRGITSEEEDALMAPWERELEAQYWRPRLMDGALPICHLGCALRQWLVITGRRAGEIWNDDRVDDGGIAPLTKDGRRIDFARWYEGWLDASLRQARRARK